MNRGEYFALFDVILSKAKIQGMYSFLLKTEYKV